MANGMSSQLYAWDICALPPANDNETWTYRRSLAFLALSSSIAWASIGLVLRLTAFH
jgi:hypothetical protein